MAYKTVSKLDDYIKKYKNEVSLEKDKVITIKEVMEEVGEHAGISWGTVKQFKNKDMQPSLAVAIRIADFFNTTVEEIWTVESYDNPEINVNKKTEIQKKEKPKCKESNCYRESFARGYCNKHYQQFRNLNPNDFKIEKPKECSEPNCNNPYHAKNFCAFHYNRHYREGRYQK